MGEELFPLGHFSPPEKEKHYAHRDDPAQGDNEKR
jgi:hypothetical protein